MAVALRADETRHALTDGSWESIQRPLARLRMAIEVAEDELLHLRCAYTQFSKRATTLRELEPAAAMPLTGQESRVAILLAAGHHDKEIATRLHVSVNTVKTQVKSILRKLQVRSRWEVARAMRAEGS